jgi:peptide/nickel transport system substrate-binding protein
MLSRGAAGSFLVAVVATAGCKARGPESFVRIGHETSLPPSLDPVTVPDSLSESILANFYEGLSALDRDMGLGPGLARSWITPDDHTWLIELRPGVRFHDGSALTAREVERALERARDSPQSSVRRMLSGVREVETLDDHHVKLVTEAPDPLLIQRLSHVRIGREVQGRDGAREVVGTGPYRPVAWGPRAFEARAFDDHHGGRPAIDRVTFVPGDAHPGIRQRLRAGEVDVARWTGPSHELPAGIRLVSRHAPGCTYLWFDGRQPSRERNPFSDRRVRQAASLALDRTRLARSMAGTGTPAHQLVPEGIFGHAVGLPKLRHDPAAARKLLGEAGYAEGIVLGLDYAEMGSVSLPLADALRAQLSEVGIRVVLKKRAWTALVQDWRAGRLAFFLAGWLFEDKDAYSFLTDCIQTRDPERGTGQFNPGISSPVLDDLIRGHARITAPRERLDRYEALMRAAREEMPLVPLVIPEIEYAVAARVRWQPRLDGMVLAAEMSLAEPGR